MCKVEELDILLLVRGESESKGEEPRSCFSMALGWKLKIQQSWTEQFQIFLPCKFVHRIPPPQSHQNLNKTK